MPKQKPLIPTELILAKLSDRSALSDEIRLISSQVGMILARTQDKMEEDRKVGNPPPFIRDGGTIKYRLGDVRAVLDSQRVFSNTTEARLHAERAVLLGFTAFNDWLDGAEPADAWPFLIRKRGGPVDFWKSLGMDGLDGDEECGMLMLEDYLERRRDAARVEASLREVRELGDHGTTSAGIGGAGSRGI